MLLHKINGIALPGCCNVGRWQRN